ncbi:hypothetical protein [Williamsia sp. CHRR-6]|uniref:DUF6992 family protein n=1 Tax=Williamsia sp. CHRR-6 TaxID=2835871 RepID=UPI001BD9E788|nr:hypothetical protein [Williamsia sp. CHRR-6]MBT0565556.1 hypothetical protein [Williamsia sp. CHRR-6]
MTEIVEMGDQGPRVARRLSARLATWGAVSTLGGAVLAVKGTSAGVRAFGLQNAVWGAIDLGIAAVGAAAATPPTAGRLRTVLLINTGLDAGYVAAGAHIAVRTPDFGGRVTRYQARGHGCAVIVQGAALFWLDLIHAQQLR